MKSQEEIDAELHREKIRQRLEARMQEMWAASAAGASQDPLQHDTRPIYAVDRARKDMPRGTCWEQHELAWTIFEKDHDCSDDDGNTTIIYDAIPWPPEENSIEQMMIGIAELVTAESGTTGPQALKGAFRLLSLRWHPDKFRGRWEGRIEESNFDQIFQRVLSISQEVNTAYRNLRR